MYKIRIEDPNFFQSKNCIQIANKIEKCLLENKWTKKDFANKMGMSEFQIDKILLGNIQNLTLRKLTKLEAILGFELISIPKNYEK